MISIRHAAAGAGIGAVVGMIVGGAIGAHHKIEKWAEVEVENISMPAGAGRNGDIALMLSVHF